MCGRYYVDEETNHELLKIIRNLDKRLQETPPQVVKKERRIKTGEIYPSDTVPVICQGRESACYEAMSWGYSVPCKMDPQDNTTVKNKSTLVINARSESAHEKPMFSSSLQSSRIVIPASGFFEWSHNAKKQKYYFTLPDSPMLYMAGLAKYFDTVKSFVILTTGANESMEDIHNRMPVLLSKEEIPNYLSSREYADFYLHRKPIQLKRELISKQDLSKKEETMYDQMQLSIE